MDFKVNDPVAIVTASYKDTEEEEKVKFLTFIRQTNGIWTSPDFLCPSDTIKCYCLPDKAQMVREWLVNQKHRLATEVQVAVV